LLDAPRFGREAGLAANLTVAREAVREPGTDEGAPTWAVAAIADLAADDVRWNATKALRVLVETPEPIDELLERALDSHDHQQRQLAAIVLQQRVQEPSDRLLEVTLEGLRVDELPFRGRGRTNGADNEARATAFLLLHAERMRPQLVRGLNAEDLQERFLCAYILGRSRCYSALPLTCNVLIEHLHDNEIRNDARMAADALHSLGASAMHYLLFAESDADDQALCMLRLIQDDIASMPRDAEAHQRRRERHPHAHANYDPTYPVDPVFALRSNYLYGWQALARCREAGESGDGC